MSNSLWPHRRQPARLPSLGFSRQEYWSGLPFPSPMRESEVSQSCLTLRNSMDCGLPGFSIHGIFQARVLEWGAIASSFPHQLSILIDLKIRGFHLLKIFTHKIRRLKNYEASEETNNLKEENQGKKFEAKSSHWNRRNLGNYISCFLNTHIYIFNKTRANGATEKYSRIIVKCFESSYFLKRNRMKAVKKKKGT